MLIEKQLRLDEIEIGDIVITKENCRYEEIRKKALKVINIQDIKKFELVCNDNGTVYTLTLSDLYCAFKISF